ncbi:MAG: SoxR reducing system RseC family protein [Candidatus Omnitrophica bacterium]|nr:SoxR reducing system RseC family protein [Candidatus Omnitrophota bacterium]MDD5429766.1 SoxR reducing system RseC family protein [Candidatus Omnitrophota bacterium]
MAKETVEVVGIHGDKIEVAFPKKAMCSCCRINSLCGQNKDLLMIGRPSWPVAIGDKLQVDADEKKAFLSGSLLFLFPAGLFLISLFVFRFFGDLGSFLLSLAIVFTYYLALRIYLRFNRKKFDLKIVGKI